MCIILHIYMYNMLNYNIYYIFLYIIYYIDILLLYIYISCMCLRESPGVIKSRICSHYSSFFKLSVTESPTIRGLPTDLTLPRTYSSLL